MLFGTSWYKSVQVSTKFLSFGTGRYKSVQDFQNWYKTVQDGTSQYKIFRTGTGWYKTVQASTKFPVQVQDGTRRYKLVPDFHSYYAYRTVQDSTSQYRIFLMVHTGTYSYEPVHTIYTIFIPLGTIMYCYVPAHTLLGTKLLIIVLSLSLVQGGTRPYP